MMEQTSKIIWVRIGKYWVLIFFAFRSIIHKYKLKKINVKN